MYGYVCPSRVLIEQQRVALGRLRDSSPHGPSGAAVRRAARRGRWTSGDERGVQAARERSYARILMLAVAGVRDREDLTSRLAHGAAGYFIVSGAEVARRPSTWRSRAQPRPLRHQVVGVVRPVLDLVDADASASQLR